jgi:hypothetical protein
VPYSPNTPYLNTIPPEREERAPGDRAVEHRIRSLIRWNALAMVFAGQQGVQRDGRPHRQLRVLAADPRRTTNVAGPGLTSCLADGWSISDGTGDP